MGSIAKIVDQIKANPNGVHFTDLKKVCEHYFGDARVNIQNHKGKAKPYQVKQVLLAIDKIEVGHDF